PLVGRRVRAFRTDRVAIETDDRCARDGRAHLLLDTLRAHAQLLEARAPAGGAGLRHARLATAAAMADEYVVGLRPYVGGLRPPGRWGLRPPRTPHAISERDLAGGTEKHMAA